MKTSRIIFLIILVTAISVCYVWQQVEIVKLAYGKQKNSKVYRDISDMNVCLRYSVLTLGSSMNLAKNIDMFDKQYEIPNFSQIVDLRTTQDKDKLASLNNEPSLGRSNIFLSLFSPGSQAEAQTK